MHLIILNSSARREALEKAVRNLNSFIFANNDTLDHLKKSSKEVTAPKITNKIYYQTRQDKNLQKWRQY